MGHLPTLPDFEINIAIMVLSDNVLLVRQSGGRARIENLSQKTNLPRNEHISIMNLKIYNYISDFKLGTSVIGWEAKWNVLTFPLANAAFEISSRKFET